MAVKIEVEAPQENYQVYLSNFSSSMTLDDYFLDHLTATNEKIDFVRLNEDGVVQYLCHLKMESLQAINGWI